MRISFCFVDCGIKTEFTANRGDDFTIDPWGVLGKHAHTHKRLSKPAPDWLIHRGPP